jgi:hypothetical protein
MRVIKEKRCGGFQVLIGVFPSKGIIAVSEASRVDRIDFAVLRFFPGSFEAQLTFDIVDDEGVLPGEDLRLCQYPLPSPRPGINQDVAQLPLVRRRPDAEDAVIGGFAHEEAGAVHRVAGDVRKLVGMGEPVGMQLLLRRKEEVVDKPEYDSKNM